MIDPTDLAACERAIEHGSKSFHAASRLLPRRVREPALALYAFCRLADDAVDLSGDETAAVRALRDRLDRVYAGTPLDDPADRAFAAVVAEHEMPRLLPDALLEGFAWDALGMRYDTVSDVRAYGARVAGAVGAMMTVLMGVRDGDALARACDLGVAMQLTNIARDVGEDARAGRIYLPLDWLAEAKIDPEALIADPRFTPELGIVVSRLLREADRLYTRATAGIAALPPDCRSSIHAARLIYGAIGGQVRRNRYDSISVRARTGNVRKAVLALGALGASLHDRVMPRSAVLHAPALPETAFLVEAARRAPRPAPFDARLSGLLAAFAELERRDRADRQGLAG